MHKKRVNSVSSKAKSKNKSKSLAEHHKAYISMAVSMVVLLLAVIFVYPMIGDDGVVGKAWEDYGSYKICDSDAPPGFEWDSPPFDGWGNKRDNFAKITTNKYPGNTQNEGYCPGVNDFEKSFCITPLNPNKGPNDYTCYTPNSVIYGKSDWLCANYNEDENIDWIHCKEETEGKDYGSFTCSDGKWVKTDDSYDPVDCDDFEGETKNDGKFYCYDYLWEECTSENKGEFRDEYVCSLDKWNKCSVDALGPLSGANEYFCDGTSWNTCEKNDEDDLIDEDKYICKSEEWEKCSGNKEEISTNNQYACLKDKWQTCTTELGAEEKLIHQNDNVCYDSLWNPCDKDSFGTITPSFQYHCGGSNKNYLWKSEFNIDQDNFYEVKVKGLNTKRIIAENTYSNLYLCDTETKVFQDKATLCYGNDDELELASLTNLNSGAKKPYDDENNLLFIYEEPAAGEQKIVSVIFLQELGDEETFLSSGKFAENLINGQRLGLKLPTDDTEEEGKKNYEFYLLSHEPAELFDFNKLTITHLPTKKQFKPTLVPANHYQFTVLAEKAITFTQQSGKIKITVDAPGEAPLAYPLPFNFLNKYEIPFSTSEPIILTSVGNAQITVCGNDEPADPLTLLVCQDDTSLVTLEKDVLTTATINDQEVALLYQLSTNEDGTQKKQGHIFQLEILSGIKKLDFNDYVNNMVEGRRVAVEFQNELYLLEHPVDPLNPVQQFISLSSLNLVKYSGSESIVPYPASGSEKKVDFLIPEGKVILVRNFADTPPPFEISALTKQQIIDTPLDLKKQLFATMSNHIPVQITNPNFGIISVDEENDLTGFDASFKVVSENSMQLSSIPKLSYQIPTPAGTETLFYYFSANVEDNQFVKTVKIYRLFSIGHAAGTHNFDNQFIETFTAGNELAISSEGFYYLLGYEGATSEGKTFFSLDKLTLKLLNGTEEEFTGSVDFATQSVTFPVLKGDISVEVNDDTNEIKFFSKTADSLITEKFDADSALLTTKNKVTFNNKDYEICDTADIKLNEEIALLCPTKKLLHKNKPESIGNKIFWYQGMINGEKIIKISNVENIDIKPIPFSSWSTLVNNVNEDKSKIYQWQSQLFELSGGNQFGSGDSKLEGYSLKTVPDGLLYPLKNVKSSPEGLQNGTFVYNEHLLTAKQSLDKNTFSIGLTLTPESYKLLSGAGMNITDLATPFAYSLEAPLYVLEQSPHYNNKNLLWITLKELDQPFFYRSLFASGMEKDVLLTSGDKLNIKFNSTSTGPLIIIKK